MSYCEPANREFELGLFDRMVAGETRERILLLQADGQFGKTTLLLAFERRCPGRVPCASLDLKGRSTGLHELLYRLCDHLGWDHFPRFRNCVQGLGGVSVDRNVLIGWAEIQVALTAPDEQERKARRAQLTQALFDDLRAWRKRLVLLFDTYEQADPEVQDWLAGPFLARARQTANLVVVVAGREVPVPTVEWEACCCHHCLGNVVEVSAWEEYARRRGWPVPRPWIEGYCAAVKGHPAQMEFLLTGAAGGGGR